MINIFTFINSQRFHVVRNLFYSALLQGSIYFFGFVAVPYLTRVLGAEEYGALSFSVSLNAYVWVLVDWGFSTGGTREVAANRDDPNKLRAIFWDVMSAKAILGLTTASLVAVFTLLLPSPSYQVTLAPALLSILGVLLSVDWFVQGFERMGLYALTTVTGRAISVALTLLLVHRPEDVWIAAIVQGASGLLGSIGGLAVARRLSPLGFPKLNWRRGLRQLAANRHFFIVGSNVIIYSAAAPLMLNFTSGMVAVGLFAAGDKVLKICLALLAPAATVMYPRTVAMLNTDRKMAATWAGRSLILQLPIFAFLSLGMYFGADLLTNGLLGRGMAGAAIVVKWLAVAPVICSVNRVLVSQILLPLGWSAETAKIMNMLVPIYLTALAIFGWALGPVGAAIAFIIAETAQVLLFTLLVWRKDRYYFLNALRGVNPLTFLSRRG